MCSCEVGSDGQVLLQTRLQREPPESLRRIRKVEAIKADILRKLRLNSPPEIKNPGIPDLPSLQAQIRQVEEGSVVSDVDDIAAGAKLFRLSEAVPGKNNIVFFNLSANHLLTSSNIEKAIFCVYVRKIEYEHRYRRTVLFIHDGHSTDLLTRHEIKFKDTGTWVYIDLTEKVKEWQESPSTNHGVEVTCTDNVGSSVVLLHARDQADRYSVPVLEIEIFNKTLHRRKRALNEGCEVFSSGEKCCRQPLVVNFTDLGWHYIIAPKVIATYFCRGECPLLHLEHPHSYITNNNLCCAPKMYSSVDMIYYDESMNIIVGKIPGVVVEKCFCI